MRIILKKVPTKYRSSLLKIIKPSLEKHLNTDFDSIPDNAKPMLGLIVAGYSNDAPLSEVWQINMVLEIMEVIMHMRQL